MAVAVTYAPTAAGQNVDALDLDSDGGSVTVDLSGTSGTPGQLQVTPPAVAFGSVPVGSVTTGSFTVRNAGGSALTITKSKPPALGVFTAGTTLAEGTVLQPGQSVTESVSFRPAGLGAAADQWVLNGSGTSVLTDVALTGTGVSVPSLPGPPSAGGWGLAGSAVMSGSDVVLTGPVAWQAGSVSSPSAVATDGLTVAFDAVIGGGNGADGMTMALASASSTKRLGFSAGSLGYSGISGPAVGLVTFKNTGEPSANFVGVAEGGPVSPGIPNWLSTSTAVPTLEGATTHVVVSVSGHTITVAVAGTVVLTTVVADLPTLADIVFTAGTGGRTDNHIVRNVKLSQRPSLPGPPSAGGWGLAGSAVMSGSDVVLTGPVAWQAGSVSSPSAVATDGLTVAFDAVIGGGNGADGMTMALASASSTKRLGFSAGSLGYSGISGPAVGLVTFKNTGEPSANFVGVAEGGPVSPGIPNWLSTSTAVPTLEGATTHVVVSVSGHTITVAVAGTVVLTTVVADLPTLADIVFTAGTGGRTDNHIVRNVTLTYGPPSTA